MSEPGTAAAVASNPFARLLSLRPDGRDAFIGGSPDYWWGGLYGGQLVAQSLMGASRTIDHGWRAHSLHAYFLQRGEPRRPVRYMVERTRDGRSVVTRRVRAWQGDSALMELAVSFCGRDVFGHDVEVSDLGGPNPEECPAGGWSDSFERRFVAPPDGGRAQAWARVREALGDDPHLHDCALAFISDDLPTDALACPEAVSLDHSIWFHRPSRGDAWHLHDFGVERPLAATGIAVGRVFDRAGRHVATVVQEVLRC